MSQDMLTERSLLKCAIKTILIYLENATRTLSNPEYGSEDILDKQYDKIVGARGSCVSALTEVGELILKMERYSTQPAENESVDYRSKTIDPKDELLIMDFIQRQKTQMQSGASEIFPA